MSSRRNFNTHIVLNAFGSGCFVLVGDLIALLIEKWVERKARKTLKTRIVSVSRWVRRNN